MGSLSTTIIITAGVWMGKFKAPEDVDNDALTLFHLSKSITEPCIEKTASISMLENVTEKHYNALLKSHSEAQEYISQQRSILTAESLKRLEFIQEHYKAKQSERNQSIAQESERRAKQSMQAVELKIQAMQQELQRKKQLEEEEEEKRRISIEKQRLEHDRIQRESAQKEAAQRESIQRESAQKQERESQKKSEKVVESKYPFMEQITALNSIVSQLDPNMKNSRLEIKMKLHKRINQISKSISQIRSVASDAIQLFNQLSNNIKYASLESASPLYCLALSIFAEKVIEQAETQVSAHTDSAYPIAVVCVLVYSAHPLLIPVLLGGLFQRSPLMNPFSSLPFGAEAGRSEQLVKLGMRGGESEQVFMDRLSGCAAFLAALMQTDSQFMDAQVFPNLYSIDHAWPWLASFLNNPSFLACPYSVPVLVTFLTVCGFSMRARFGRQFQKILLLIQEEYLHRIPKSAVAAQTRLEILVRDSLSGSKGICIEPEGRKIK